MIHARSDYNRIQDPAIQDTSLLSEGSTPIAEDEPVFLVRASDQAFVATLMAWIEWHLKGGGNPGMAEAVADHIEKGIAWQEANRVKTADAPEFDAQKMTPEELFRVRCDLHERGFPADDWSDETIEGLPRWNYGDGWMFATLRMNTGDEIGDIIVEGINAWRVGYPQTGTIRTSIIDAVEFVEKVRPCNRLAILHLLEKESVKQ